MKTNSNTYTIIYSAILVVIVAFLLAFVSQSLKEKQDKNVALDTKKQILYSLNIRGLDDDAASEKYDSVIFKIDYIGEGKDRVPYIYYAKIDGKEKYVLPMKGMGLWGGISGFLSINDDKQTVYGAYFNHESETAGLGAEIKDSQSWQEQFGKNKKLFVDGDTLSVVKKKDEGKEATQVDGVTGATLTSDGVSNMIRETIRKYKEFLKK
jgi:Na+-transporting NADH:ubiquinone oxidoreductase subunit C